MLQVNLLVVRGMQIQQILFSRGHVPITQVRRAWFLTDVGDLLLGVIVIVIVIVIVHQHTPVRTYMHVCIHQANCIKEYLFSERVVPG